MLVLGIESASDQCGCALASEDGVLAEIRLALPRRHAEALAPQMRFVCKQAGVALGDVDAVAVDHGPGLFTGLRAGLATAKATAAALEIAIVPVGSLEALAHGTAAVAQPGETVLSLLDARRGEVFGAWYRVAAPPPNTPGTGSRLAGSVGDSGGVGGLSSSAPGTDSRLAGSVGGSGGVVGDSGSTGVPRRVVQLSAPRVGLPADLLPALMSPGARPSGRTIVVGDGALRYADLLRTANALIAGPEFRFPSPAAVALLGRERALAGETVAPEQVDALYLRSPDAQPRSSPESTNAGQPPG